MEKEKGGPGGREGERDTTTRIRRSKEAYRIRCQAKDRERITAADIRFDVGREGERGGYGER